MKIKKLIVLTLTAFLLSACSAPKLGYFQDVSSGQINQLSAPQFIKIQPGDKLSILVSSKNPELAYLYNLPIVGHYSSSRSDASMNSSQIASYAVDESGNIDFPILGPIHIAGMTRSEVGAYVKTALISKSLIKDPTVTVDFLDLYISVLGEVKDPGRFIIDHDKITVLDAISRAGDLTIYGRRDNVLVLREENGTQTSYRLDLTNSKSIYDSPVFYLKQNDMIYVEPNDVKSRESTVNGNNVRSTSFWISLASLMTSIALLIFKY
jgi:polysaccharide export outer membrane protein